jgi:hypothetical protein
MSAFTFTHPIGAQRHHSLRSSSMNNTLRITLAAALFTVAQTAFAHDPAEHAKETAAANAGPDCAAMQNMDHSKMDMKDPVMMAMMAKCSGTAKPAEKKDAAKAGQDMKGMDMKGMKMPADAAKTKPDAHGGH